VVRAEGKVAVIGRGELEVRGYSVVECVESEVKLLVCWDEIV